MPKVLVVDDEKKNVELLRDFLENFGYEVISAFNGADALKLAQQALPDLIISDILMPIMDGFALCYEWKKSDILKEIPFVFFTSTYTDKKDEDLALRSGADLFIRKPIELKELLDVIKPLIGKGGMKSVDADGDIFRLHKERLVNKLEKKILELKQEVTERKKAEKIIEEQLAFERLTSEISANFINIPIDEAGGTIKNALSSIGNFFSSDIVFIYSFQPDIKEFRQIQVWARGERDKKIDIWPAENHYLFPGLFSYMQKNDTFTFCTLNDIPADWSKMRGLFSRLDTAAGIMVSLRVGKNFLGILTILNRLKINSWSDTMIQRVRIIGGILANALARKGWELDLQNAFRKIKLLKEALEAENVYLTKELRTFHEHAEIIGHSDAIKRVLIQAEQVSKTDSTVLILGETGTGKELLAREIHMLSKRKDKPIVIVNCAAIPYTLVESELFGHEKGTFTGALSKQIGRFEIANGSTIFLDEIGELSMSVQAKLLRVLQEGKIERLGRPVSIEVDVRIIAATNRDLSEAILKGRFREDLYYRLNVFPITIPPLRERREDIPDLVRFFVKELGIKMGKRIDSISRKSQEALQEYLWPGNVRELRNVVERAMIIASTSTLNVEVPRDNATKKTMSMTLEEIEKKHIIDTLEMTRWRVRGKNGAAEILGLKPTTLESKMQKLGIQRER